MNSFEQLWEEYEPNNKPYTLGIKPFIEGWFNRGAKEKEKEMLHFILWYSDPIGRGFQGTPKEGFEYWKESVKKI